MDQRRKRRRVTCRHRTVSSVTPHTGAQYTIPVCVTCGQVMGTASPIDDSVNGTSRVKDDDNSLSRYVHHNPASAAATRYMERIMQTYNVLRMPRYNLYYSTMAKMINDVMLPDKRASVKKTTPEGMIDEKDVKLSRSEEFTAVFAAVYYICVLEKGWWTTKKYLNRMKDKSDFNIARRVAMKYRNQSTPDLSWKPLIGRLVLGDTDAKNESCLRVVCHHIDTLEGYINSYMPTRQHKNSIECVVAGAIITLLKRNPTIPRVTTRAICEEIGINSSTASEIASNMEPR